MAIQTDVIIVGGGLSGLALAGHLQRKGIPYQLFEAHSSLGGRIKVHEELSLHSNAVYDLGPSWFWPEQPRIRALANRFDVEVIGADGAVLAQGKRVVLALPPRVAELLEFTPNLPESTLHAMKAVPTWMAGQAKICAIYETPF